MVSPIKNPQGFKTSIWSQITFTMAVKGMDKNIPGMPHKALPAKITMIEIRAFILTFDATILGIT